MPKVGIFNFNVRYGLKWKKWSHVSNKRPIYRHFKRGFHRNSLFLLYEPIAIYFKHKTL